MSRGDAKPKFQGGATEANRNGTFKKGQSGNPGGRPKFAKVIADAGFTPKELRKEIVQLAVQVVRDPDADPASWRYAHDYVAGVLGIRPPKELVIEDEHPAAEIDETELTDEQLDKAIESLDTLLELGVVNDSSEATDEPPIEH